MEKERRIALCSLAFVCLILFCSVESEDVRSAPGVLTSLLLVGSHDNKSWPFTDAHRCSRMKTRDTDYHQRASTEVSIFPRIPSCGLNRFSKVQSEETDIASATEDSTATPDRYWWKEFREYLTMFLSVFSRWKVRDQGPRGRRAFRQKKDAENNGAIEASEETEWIEEDSEDDLEEELEEVARIVGGHKTEEGEWPWLAAIGTKALGLRCGGSLISDRWILTAAHCFQDEEDPCSYNVRIGSINWMFDDSGTSIDITPDAIYRHPDYDELTSANDVALIRLSKRVELNENDFINSICLPNEARSVQPGTVCLAAGWGFQNQRVATTVTESYEVDLPVITYDGKCGFYKDGAMKAGMICAGYLDGGKDTCQGDSGGPIVYKSNGRWIQLGITSFGMGCARPGYPGIYTDVGYFIQWISSVIQRHS